MSNLVERLRESARQSSDISRRMAEDKSLRQASNTERRKDLYMFSSPESFVEWEAANEIERLREALDRQCDNIAFILNRVDLPKTWFEKFDSELSEDRKALGGNHASK